MENEADMMRLVDQARNILQSVYRALAYEPQYRLAVEQDTGNHAARALRREIESCGEAMTCLQDLSAHKW